MYIKQNYNVHKYPHKNNILNENILKLIIENLGPLSVIKHSNDNNPILSKDLTVICLKQRI